MFCGTKIELTPSLPSNSVQPRKTHQHVHEQKETHELHQNKDANPIAFSKQVTYINHLDESYSESDEAPIFRLAGLFTFYNYNNCRIKCTKVVGGV